MLLKHCCTVKNDAIHGCLSCGHISNCRVVGIMQMEYKVGCVEVKIFVFRRRCYISTILQITLFSSKVVKFVICIYYLLFRPVTCTRTFSYLINDVLIYTPQDLRVHLIPVHVYSYPTCIVHLF